MKLLKWEPTRLFAPRCCLICGDEEQTQVCTTCLNLLEPLTGKGCGRCGNPAVHHSSEQCDWCRRLEHLPSDLCALFAYRNEGRAMFHKVKYEGYWPLIRTLLDCGLKDFFRAMPFMGYQCMAPIPESWSRKWRRSFNPAAQIANRLSLATGMPVRELLAIKTFKRHQVGLDYIQRRDNARERFRLTTRTLPASVLLVDDVLTTGATLEAATSTLLNAGVKRVGWFTLFRTP